ncbi:MAG: DUF4416 family protein [Candidatus Gygaella obscura]|nr:DUF4416 family protein [Candidatus Gygaella obscura]
MRKIYLPGKVKLIIGLIAKDEDLFNKAFFYLEKKLSRIDFKSDILKFKTTNYYQSEIGKNLKRVFISFSKLITQNSLADIKLTTCRLETRLSKDKKRVINIDPGYLALSKLVLATTKDFSHRIYINKGIYEEITLIFTKDTFTELPWTYPDYRTKEYIDTFNHIRRIYQTQITN